MHIDHKIKWAILVTGWGRNARDTIEAYLDHKFTRSLISIIIYEQEPCGAADLAREHNIETLQIKRKDYDGMKSYQNALTEILKDKKVDYIFMLNYKYRIYQEMLNSFRNRILNIHPSLFPSFLATKTAIQDALDYGVKVTGITTHIIDEKLDEGIILQQKPIKINASDTFETLYPKFVKKGKKIIIKTIKQIEKDHFNTF